MPKPFRVTLASSNAQSTPWMPDYGQNPFSVGVSVVASCSGNIVYTVQHTFDPLFFDSQIAGTSVVAASLATWHNHPTLTAVSCLSVDTTYTSPVLGIRIVSTAGSTASTVRMTLVQTGP